MPVLRELTVQYFVWFDGEVEESLFLDFGGEGRGETAMLPGLRFLDLTGLSIRSHPLDLYKRISKVAPALTHLRLPTWMAGPLEGALGLGLVVASDYETTNQKPSLLPRTLQRVYIQPPHPLTFFCGNTTKEEKERALESHTSTMDGLRALESRDERVIMLDCGMEDWKMEDIVRGWDRERGRDEL